MDLNKLVRKNILALKPYSSARGNHLSGLLLDANENTLGSCFEFENLLLNRYPDPNQNELRESLSNLIGVKKKNIFFGVGSDEIIDLIFRIFCEPGVDNVIIPEPTYGMYKVAGDINNIEVKSIPLDSDFQPDVKRIIESCNDYTKLLFLCSPNNPTGNIIEKTRIIELIRKFNGVVVIDEAYMDFAEENSLINDSKDYPNLIVLRTFSKAWGLAGVRCGFCIANEFIISLLFNIKAPYNISKLTAYSIIKALENNDRRIKLIEEIVKEREWLQAELKTLNGIDKVFDSSSNYILFRCRNARDVYRLLASKGIIIRDRSNQLNLDNCLRVSVGSRNENKKFLTALKEAL